MKSIRLFVVLLALFLSVFGQGSSLSGGHSINDQIDYTAIDSYLTGQIRENRIPGAALAIVQDGKIVYAQGYGEAAPGRVMTEGTPMFIGSISKSFTAVAVMQLVEQGKVSLDAPVRQYLPSFRLRDPEQASRITVRHLLNQTSGLTPASLPNDALLESASLRDAVEMLADATLISEPGAAFAYYNPNYTILGLLVETVSGESYGEYVQKNIFTPLGMTRSFVAKADAVKAGLAQGYNHFLGFPIPRPQPHLQGGLPTGFLISTAEDMGRYLAFHLRGAESGILSAESLKVLHTPPAGIQTDYAMGWFQVQRDGIAALEHPGGVETFAANAVLLPQKDTAFILLYNLNGLLQVATVYNPIVAGLVAMLTRQPLKAAIPLWLVYMLLVILFLFDLSRKLVLLLRIPDWGRKSLQRGRSKAALGAAIEMVGAALLLVGLPFFIFAQAGLTSLQATLGYHTDIAIYILLTSLLSLALGIGRLIWFQRRQV